jgi:hypothetical protein
MTFERAESKLVDKTSESTEVLSRIPPKEITPAIPAREYHPSASPEELSIALVESRRLAPNPIAQRNFVNRIQRTYGNQFTQAVITQLIQQEVGLAESDAEKEPVKIISATQLKREESKKKAQLITTAIPVVKEEEAIAPATIEKAQKEAVGKETVAKERQVVTASAPTQPMMAAPGETREERAETEVVEAPVAQAATPADKGAVVTSETKTVGEKVKTAAGPAAAETELIMPEPPSELSDKEKSRVRRSQRRAGVAAKVTRKLPPADKNVSDARGAVKEPDPETVARAEAGLIKALGKKPEPSPKIKALCMRIRIVILLKRPPDEDSLVKAKPEEMAEDAGGQLNKNIEKDTKRVAGSYKDINTKPKGKAQLKPREVEDPPEKIKTPNIAASKAAPDPTPAENFSLKDDVAANKQRIDDAGMNTEPAKLVQTGPIANARAAQGDLEKTAKTDPNAVFKKLDENHKKTSYDMAALQHQALQALAKSRSSTIKDTATHQKGMVQTEEMTRETISRLAQGIYTNAQTLVNNQLKGLIRTAMSKYKSGVAKLSTQFKFHLKKVANWIKQRHAGAVGTFVSIVDTMLGLPDCVSDEYSSAEKKFGDGICQLITQISMDVNLVIAACEKIIKDADTQISTLFTNLPKGLEEWGKGEQATFKGKLNKLQKRVTNTRSNFTRKLATQAAQAVQDARQQIHQLRKKARGLVGKIVDAVKRFIEDPIKAIIEGLLWALSIPASAFWAVVNKIKAAIPKIAKEPKRFCSNLFGAIGKGFGMFFDHFPTHLFSGFIRWLFRCLPSVGVMIPTEFSLKAVITFFLQVMGITWARIRITLAKHIGEENVAHIEKAYELLATLIKKGPSGIYEMIEDKINPQSILNQIIQFGVNFIVESVIKNVAKRVLLLFNPVGAILQIIEAIYKVLKWIFVNAARIFSLIQTIVNGITNIIAGNITGMALAIEKALAGIIPIVIDFLASFFGFGDLPNKIAKKIEGFQSWIMGYIDRAIGWLAKKAKSLLAKLGFKKKEQKAETPKGAFDGQVGKVVTWKVAGESHRMWIVKKGKNCTVMMASEVKSLPEQLKEFGDLAKNKKKSKKQAIIGLIGQANAAHTDLDKKADSLAQKLANPNTSQAVIKKEDDAVEKAEESLSKLLWKIRDDLGLTKSNWGTKEKPIQVDWPKRASIKYPIIYLGPRSKKIISQNILRANVGKKYKGAIVEKYVPHGKRKLPFGKKEMGITTHWQIATGKMIKLKPSETKTPGGGKVKDPLKKLGFEFGSKMNADHVTELQIGGSAADKVDNLWPLDAGENQASGRNLANMVFNLKGEPKSIQMKELKSRVKNQGDEIWFIIKSTK